MDLGSIFSSYDALCTYVNHMPAELGEDQLLLVPTGLRNNILWNLGHLIVDNCDMLYRPANIDPPHPMSFGSWFDAGTSPSDWTQTPPIKSVLEISAGLSAQISKDFQQGRFEHFDPKLVVSGWPVSNFEETLAYVTNHTSIHLGVMMTLRRLVS